MYTLRSLFFYENEDCLSPVLFSIINNEIKCFKVKSKYYKLLKEQKYDFSFGLNSYENNEFYNRVFLENYHNIKFFKHSWHYLYEKNQKLLKELLCNQEIYDQLSSIINKMRIKDQQKYLPLLL